MEKKQFVEGTMSETVCAAASWVDHLEYIEADEVVAIICQNGHCYYQNVACDSLSAIVEDVIRCVLRHS